MIVNAIEDLPEREQVKATDDVINSLLRLQAPARGVIHEGRS